MSTSHIDCKFCTDKSCAVSMLNDDELQLLSENVSEVMFRKGEGLFKQSTLSGHVIYIKSGLVKVHMSAMDQRDYILKIATPPSYLGLPTLFGDHVNRYSATAIEPTKVCFIDFNTFKDLIHKNGKFAYAIIEDISSDDLYNFSRYVNQAHKQTPGRLAGALIYFSKEVYKSDSFTLALTRNEIAEMINTCREGVTRQLSRFKAEGIIELDKNHISIKKPDILEKINQVG